MEYPRPIPGADPPPHGVHVLAHWEGRGWWQAQYFPEDDNAAYQADAWQFVGTDAPLDGGKVTHWMPMPPSPKA